MLQKGHTRFSIPNLYANVEYFFNYIFSVQSGC